MNAIEAIKMKKTVFLMAALMTALAFTACSKNEDDEPEVKKPSIEEVLRLDDMLYVAGETIDVDVMTAQYQETGYSEVTDLRMMSVGKMAGFISYWNPELSCTMMYDMDGSLCCNAECISGLFTYDMKDEAIRYINKRLGVSLQKREEPKASFKEFFTADGVMFGINDTSCMVATARHPIN